MIYFPTTKYKFELISNYNLILVRFTDIIHIVQNINLNHLLGNLVRTISNLDLFALIIFFFTQISA